MAFPSLPTDRCPHCGSQAVIEPKGEGASLRWVCGVCGGPRMPGGLGGEAATTALKEAKVFLSRATRSKAASVVLAVMAAFVTLVLIAAWPAALVAKLVLFALAAMPAAFAARARLKAAEATEKATDAEGRAWLAAAEDAVKKNPSGLTQEELAKTLKIDPARAEALLTQLAVHDRTRIDVGDDAEIRYSVSGADLAQGQGKVRVAAPEGDAAPIDDPLEREFAALEEAEAKKMKAKP